MSKKRAMTPELWSSMKWLRLDPETRLTSLGLLMLADDWGRGPADVLMIRSMVYPVTADMELITIEEHLLVLAELGFLTVYPNGMERCYAITQMPRVEGKATPSEYPPPPPSDSVRTGSESPSEPIPVVGGGGAGAREGAGARGGALGGDPPPPFCERHPNGTEDNCRGCGNARRAHDWYWQQRKAAEQAPIDGDEA